jgi:hypothetical protein
MCNCLDLVILQITTTDPSPTESDLIGSDDCSNRYGIVADLAESDTGISSRPHFFLGGVERIQICIVVDASEGGVLEGRTGEQ